MIKLNVGCGIGLLAGFLNIDKYMDYDALVEGHRTKEGSYKDSIIELEPDGTPAKFLQADISDTKLPDAYADYVLLNNVLEHLPMAQLLPAIKEMKRVMKPGAEICIICPDFNNLAELWTKAIASQTGTFKNWDLFLYLAEVIYGNQAHEGEFHRSPITPDLLNYLFQLCGFEQIVVTCYPIHTAVPDYDGNRTALDSVCRTDTLVARAKVPVTVSVELWEHIPAPEEIVVVPNELCVNVSDGTKVKGGLR
jgi:SAM-dependent methyltransferase